MCSHAADADDFLRNVDGAEAIEHHSAVVAHRLFAGTPYVARTLASTVAGSLISGISRRGSSTAVAADVEIAVLLDGERIQGVQAVAGARPLLDMGDLLTCGRCGPLRP